MTEVASRVILPTTIWFSVSHLADWLITESDCSLAACAFSRRASLCLKFICFTLERPGVPVRGMTHKSSLRQARRRSSFTLVPSFLRENLRTLTARIASLSQQRIRNRRELSWTFRETAFRNPRVRKNWRGAKIYTHSSSSSRKHDNVFFFFFPSASREWCTGDMQSLHYAM